MDSPRPHTDPRVETTRSRILDKAIEMFATMGYEGASTRQLAAEAGVNQPAIQYHFTSKEGLYRAAVDCIATEIEQEMATATARIDAALREPVVIADVQDALLNLLDTFADMVLDQKEQECQGMFIARAELENSTMLEPLGGAIVRCMIGPCALSVAKIAGIDDMQEANLRAIAIVGQLVNFKNKCLGNTIRQSLGLGEFGDEMKNTVKALVREHTLAILAAAKAARA